MKSRLFPLVSGLLLVLSGCQHYSSPATQITSAAPALAPASATSTPVISAAPAATTPSASESTYVFGWGDVLPELAKPRGGSSRGAPVTLAPGKALPLSGVAGASNAFERDRAAILALSGDYRVSFHFMESVGLAEDYKPVRPYHSWATEHVQVIADTGRFISLQHTLVMFFMDKDGTVSRPEMIKHWRQDWTYEDTDLHTYRGANTWARRRLTAAEAADTWSQAVFQVDDSPRYEAFGRWEHRGNLSAWTGDNELRPLPRREHTAGKDYSAMEGRHSIVITPTGWLHEQRNWKRVAGEAGGEPRYLAQELGLDRYDRISAPSLAAAEADWQKTGSYWAAVRQVWSDILAQNDRFSLRTAVDKSKLYEEHFAYTEKLEDGQPYDPTDGARHARETVARFLVIPTQP